MRNILVSVDTRKVIKTLAYARMEARRAGQLSTVVDFEDTGKAARAANIGTFAGLTCDANPDGTVTVYA